MSPRSVVPPDPPESLTFPPAIHARLQALGAQVQLAQAQVEVANTQLQLYLEGYFSALGLDVRQKISLDLATGTFTLPPKDDPSGESSPE